MAHPDNETFSIDLGANPSKEKLDALTEIMDKQMDAYFDYAQALAKELNVSDGCAVNIMYLRGRSRWTQELENELIAAHARGDDINMGDFGHNLDRG